ncbi:beta-ketoacyl synthase N-terminal-like domain-containing protein [Streptomyces sp. N35]|uniref:beta-ketoacyl synthase N-terminal-like domain-containing protein n=1 Tax=Streptomyces sp. N35 TaxID=2795730 RepID=UPI0018F27E8F|nr:beta-ketoacyl synthase N-terminal-like domain-containing protein [Streptomyces sp. N35]
MTGLYEGQPAHAPPDTDPVAVVGMGVVVPGADSPEALWRQLQAPSPVFTEPGPRFDLAQFWSDDPAAADRSYSPLGGYLHDFVPSPQLAPWAPGERDPAAVWLRHVLVQARSALPSAHRTDGGADGGPRTGVYIGAWPGGLPGPAETHVLEATVAAVGRALGAQDAQAVRAALSAHYRHAHPDGARTRPTAIVRSALEGIVDDPTELMVVDTACSSALYAIDLGTKALLSGACDVAYCGGVLALAPANGVFFGKLRGLSPTGRVRSMDRTADGTLFSDGAGMVVLKRLSRARADGDRVLALLAGFGGATDGRGTSVFAPNPAGQRRAVERARAVNALGPYDIRWVIAHATGTPAGDLAELRMLSALAPADGHVCTSNKGVVGHTGWAAGAVSLIHAILALHHQEIPPQHSFGGLPDAVADARLTIPDEPLTFRPGPRDARTVGVSAFGFGGTNGHLLVREPPPADRPTPLRLRSSSPRSDDAAVLVGWSALLPGAPGRREVEAWLRGTGKAPQTVFPRPYPLPDFTAVRMPPRTMRGIDPCHLMAIESANQLAAEYGALWDGLRERTGVIGAYTGLPLSLARLSLRCYADDTLAALERAGLPPRVLRAAREWSDAVRSTVPPPSEDSQAGVMPGVMASRIAAHVDLHGPSLTVDAGPDSARAALHVAERLLATGELELALVSAVAPQPLSLPADGARGQAEGAFLLAVTSARTARAHGWDALARVDRAPEQGGLPAGAEAYEGLGAAIALLGAATHVG